MEGLLIHLCAEVGASERSLVVVKEDLAKMVTFHC